ncbi:MAG: hypothetical protein HKO65_17610 [Gemmatimonadetes bacterium]|nr:hypothetical protein [Gemmatimonadota bacterium]NNM06918.1 hypothetical protein [Gemmatimonadota bacterium]
MRTMPVGVLLLTVTVITNAGCGSDAPPSDHTTNRTGERDTGSAPVAYATLELETSYPEGFTFLNGIRELSDGTILAADPLAEILLRINLDESRADTIGRAGPGPQEYEQPDQVFPLPGDSTLLVDLGKMQLTALGPDGIFGDGIPMAVAGDGPFPMVLHPRFVDDLGRLYDRAARSRDGGPTDSVAVIRFDRADRQLDTVATLWSPEVRQTRSRGGGFVPEMLGPMDAWAVGPDGSVAVVRAQGFSVEWWRRGGERIPGPPNRFPTHTVGRAEKEAVVAGIRSSGISMTAVASPDGSVSRMTMNRGLSFPGEGPSVDDYEWAERLPPFRPDRARVSPSGELWVERYLPADSLPQMIVFDGQGQILGEVALPPDRRLIGLADGRDGDQWAYLVRTDEFDLKWLERYRVVR